MNDQQRAAMQGALLALEDAHRRDEHSAARWVYSEAMDAMREALAQPQGEPVACWCRTCRPITLDDMRFVVCPDCGNKRCPKANDHRQDCTNSNEPGQKGSAYEYTTPPSVEAAIDWEKLRDPFVLHLNLLRGFPARLTPDMLKHLMGNEFDKYVEAMRIETLEKAAKVCESEEFAVWETAERIAAAIRGMK